MMDGKDRAGECHASDGTTCNENRLEVEGRNVADKGDFWVNLARISWLANRQPPDEKNCERGEPGDSGYEGEDPKLVRITEILWENPRPRSRCHLAMSFPS